MHRNIGTGNAKEGNLFTRIFDDADLKGLLRKFELYSNEGHFNAEANKLSADRIDNRAKLSNYILPLSSGVWEDVEDAVGDF